jgi:hypothetical protein
MITRSVVISGQVRLIWLWTHLACHNANWLPRVPIRIVLFIIDRNLSSLWPCIRRKMMKTS